jgi:hypothetical protein
MRFADVGVDSLEPFPLLVSFRNPNVAVFVLAAARTWNHRVFLSREEAARVYFGMILLPFRFSIVQETLIHLKQVMNF